MHLVHVRAVGEIPSRPLLREREALMVPPFDKLMVLSKVEAQAHHESERLRTSLESLRTESQYSSRAKSRDVRKIKKLAESFLEVPAVQKSGKPRGELSQGVAQEATECPRPLPGFGSPLSDLLQRSVRSKRLS